MCHLQQQTTSMKCLVLFSNYLIFVGSMISILACGPDNIPASDRPLAVLTFDDAVKSHRTFVAPLLKQLGFDASFFVTYAWMEDTSNFMNWQDIGELYEMGFEIGNQSWTCGNFSQPAQAFELNGELGMVESQLKHVNVPKPISFAHPGNAFGPESISALVREEYHFARRGNKPNKNYGNLNKGSGYDPQKHHPLLIPTTIDFGPEMTYDFFVKTMQKVPVNEIAVLQFHGVPDIAHPWLNSSEEDFYKYMNYLKEHNYKVMALRDLEQYLPASLPQDPLLNTRYPTVAETDLEWPMEVIQSRNDIRSWIQIMLRHKFTNVEMAAVLGLNEEEILRLLESTTKVSTQNDGKIEALPYPGGRHPRIDFREGMLSPRRGTELSVFLPWDGEDFVVLDLPEAVFTQYGLTFLGHKHVPTIFDLQKISVPNSDWQQDSLGNWINLWTLPNKIEIGAEFVPKMGHAIMHLWLTNNTTDTIFKDLRTQICVMLGQTKHFSQQTNENKKLACPSVAVESEGGDKWIIIAWEGCINPWGNIKCPCLHADPSFPDCAPGQTVTLSGILSFYEGSNIDLEIDRVWSKLKEF